MVHRNELKIARRVFSEGIVPEEHLKRELVIGLVNNLIINGRSDKCFSIKKTDPNSREADLELANPNTLRERRDSILRMRAEDIILYEASIHEMESPEDEVFSLANRLAKLGYGNQAMVLHRVHNELIRIKHT